MDDSVKQLLETSATVNSRVMTLTRCLIIALLSYFVDGLQYRELRAALGVSDGKLIANLNQLVEMGFIRKSEVEFDKKKLDVYLLTDSGRKELSKISRWMKLIITVARGK
jgi:DNA-binding MarR family transcriptional regulator